ncbi:MULTISPECIES: RsmD family RNA methyltransferase [Maribacter]|uniref:Methyltransferase domain-containing protein n=1 Tax=Maribacter flavus TaxID=1658664 RepID=A0A5B2TPQ9_9FLAO|nr:MULTISPECIES: RsmD family RNA methyltransferase [Maribacter]KAA2216522.1 methyltransferase domain-containing protein [Maribacter flavus]MDC6406781.1 RsmD family RNA methyltransferase [Maribacter sp. PR66]MEE1973777.1 RsmD family RNA methyltransferase [Maribacter flavus]
MRIISGKHKGRQLLAPKNLPVRPTKDMAKEGLFNILNNRYYFPDLKVLDLFAGTGNISFEFASRGVDDILAVDMHSGCINYISKIANELEMDIKTVKSDVFSFLSRNTEKFDVIFADPFYDMELGEFQKLPSLIFENELLLEDGVLVIEHSKQTNLESIPHFDNSRKYGNSVFSFFKT